MRNPIKIRKCVYCKKEYIPTSNCQKYCSKICHDTARLKKDVYKLSYKNNNHRPERKEWLKEYYKSDKYKEYKSKWNKTDKGKLTTLRRHLKRRAMKNNIIETFTAEQFMEKVKLCNGMCPECKRSFDNNIQSLWVTLDHYYSVKLASEDYIRTGIKRIYTIDDVGPLCLGCNSRKRDKIIEPKDL